jgi:hypothetical protein
MISSWWLLWMLAMFLLLVPSIGYGWGYRRWGPPFPRYIQRRRGMRAASAGGPAKVDHEAWGRGGDFVWGMLIMGVFWAFAILWWH